MNRRFLCRYTVALLLFHKVVVVRYTRVCFRFFSFLIRMVTQIADWTFRDKFGKARFSVTKPTTETCVYRIIWTYSYNYF